MERITLPLMASWRENSGALVPGLQCAVFYAALEEFRDRTFGDGETLFLHETAGVLRDLVELGLQWQCLSSEAVHAAHLAPSGGVAFCRLRCRCL